MKLVLGLGAPPALADAVEDDHRVVDRQADDGHRRGQEDAVDRLVQPREEADHEHHVVGHRQHGGDTEGPLEPDGQVEQLREQRDAEGDAAPCRAARSPSEAPIVWSSILVDVAADRGRGPSSIRCSSSLVISPVRTVKSAVSAPCTTASREARVGDGLARLVDRDRLAHGVVELAAAGELDPEVEALGDDAGRRRARARRRRCPATSCGACIRVGVRAVEPGADPADAGPGR